MTEVTIGQTAYRIGKLDAIKQFHLARRLAPIQLAMGMSAKDLAGLGKDADELSIMAAIMGPIADQVAKMSDDEVNYILRMCLGVVSRQGGEKWAKVMVGNDLMFDDIEMPHLMRLTIAVVQENLGGFFAGLPGATE